MLLARPGYRRLWTARTVSQVGDVAQFTTLALLLVHLTGSAVADSATVYVEIGAVQLLGLTCSTPQSPTTAHTPDDSGHASRSATH